MNYMALTKKCYCIKILKDKYNCPTNGGPFGSVAGENWSAAKGILNDARSGSKVQGLLSTFVLNVLRPSGRSSSVQICHHRFVTEAQRRVYLIEPEGILRCELRSHPSHTLVNKKACTRQALIFTWLGNKDSNLD